MSKGGGCDRVKVAPHASALCAPTSTRLESRREQSSIGCAPVAEYRTLRAGCEAMLSTARSAMKGSNTCCALRGCGHGDRALAAQIYDSTR